MSVLSRVDVKTRMSIREGVFKCQQFQQRWNPFQLVNAGLPQQRQDSSLPTSLPLQQCALEPEPQEGVARLRKFKPGMEVLLCACNHI